MSHRLPIKAHIAGAVGNSVVLSRKAPVCVHVSSKLGK